MKIAIDFDLTIVDEVPYDDLDAELRFLPGARDAVMALHRAGHILMLYSARANRALREDWQLDPFWARGLVRFDAARWFNQLELHEGRYRKMIAFIEAELPGIFHVIDDGTSGGKPMVDLFIDDKAVTFGMGKRGMRWPQIAAQYGDDDQ